MHTTKTSNQDKEYMDSVDAAVYLKLSPNTLARWRSEKSNLPYLKIGGAIRYKKSDLDTYAESTRVTVK